MFGIEVSCDDELLLPPSQLDYVPAKGTLHVYIISLRGTVGHYEDNFADGCGKFPLQRLRLFLAVDAAAGGS